MWFKSVLGTGVLVGLSLISGFAPQSPNPETTIPGIRGYRRWTVANPKPVPIPSSVLLLCRALTEAERKEYVAREKQQNPHVERFIRVYVNLVGEKTFLNPKAARFPVGTVIVKEKLASENANAPELLTVMIKRKAGFDPQNGDWDYFVLTGDAARVLPGTKRHCQDCHLRVQKSDFVYRNYLPVPDKKGTKYHP